MNKKELLDKYFKIDPDKLSWKMYLLNFKPAMEVNPYIIDEIKFQLDSNLNAYTRELYINCGNEVACKGEMKEYSGENKEGEVVFISLDDKLIKNSYDALIDSLNNLAEEELSKVKGYIVVGIDKENPENNLLYCTMSNPIERPKLDNRTFILEEKGPIKKDVVRFKLKDKCDFFMYQNYLYSFNYKFEKLFKLESTLKRFKMAAIDRIIFKGNISNSEELRKDLINFKATKTFLSLDDDRLKSLDDLEKRKEIAERLNIELDQDNRLIIKDEADSKNLLKHLCMKMIKDSDTNKVYLATKLVEFKSEEEN